MEMPGKMSDKPKWVCLITMLITALYELGHKLNLNFGGEYRDDWWDVSQNIGGSKAIAERLVELGLWEHREPDDNFLKYLYRPIQHKFQECED